VMNAVKSTICAESSADDLMREAVVLWICIHGGQQTGRAELKASARHLPTSRERRSQP
jgi:hypothetical protein